MSTTTDEHEPCDVEVMFLPDRARGIHELYESLFDVTCEGAGHCAAETVMFSHAA